MRPRYLDIDARGLRGASKQEKLDSLKASEGRILVTECIGAFPPLLGDVSNPELATAMGSDILLVNLFDVDENRYQGIEGDRPLKTIKDLTHRLVGVNLEPVFEIKDPTNFWKMSPGRMATIENVQKLVDQEVDFLVLTGNPGTGVTNAKISEAIHTIRAHFGDQLMIIAGKMHASGSLTEAGDKLLTPAIIKDFVEAGADIILMPAPASVPGFTLEKVKQLVDYSHQLGAMTMTSIGTSQEGADPETIRQMALWAKMSGTDLHHLGDSGLTPGLASPENIMTYSIAIRGRRHTYRRIARRKEK